MCTAVSEIYDLRRRLWYRVESMALDEGGVHKVRGRSGVDENVYGMTGQSAVNSQHGRRTWFGGFSGDVTVFDDGVEGFGGG
jgi:hypothetical protein